MTFHFFNACLLVLSVKNYLLTCKLELNRIVSLDDRSDVFLTGNTGMPQLLLPMHVKLICHISQRKVILSFVFLSFPIGNNLTEVRLLMASANEAVHSMIGYNQLFLEDII